jgi:uncharacterized membrane protein
MGAVFFVMSPFATHFLLVNRGTVVDAVTVVLLLCQGLLISAMIGTRLRRRFRLSAILAVMTAILALSLFHLRGSLILSSGAPHAVVYLGLLAIFGLSLLPDREPVVTYFARAIHGGISPEIELYTRRVTWAWCAFFGLQLAGSALLLALAPIAWWSTFVNILNLPLTALMMLGEWVTRPLWVADPPREYLRDILRMPQLLGQRLKKPGAQAL